MQWTDDTAAGSAIAIAAGFGLAQRVLNRSRNGATRRRFLHASLAVAGALAASHAKAEGKVSLAEARYQPGPKGGLSCSMCTLFVPPHACKVVEGYIAPQGWCRFFDLPD